MTQSNVAFSLRPATARDQRAIMRMVWRARINPRNIKWPNFFVAHSADGRLLGVGQVKTHPQGTRELASIATEPTARHSGIASAIIQRLIELHPGELFLYCESALIRFYARFGFAEVGDAHVPADLLRQLRFGRAMVGLSGRLSGRNLRLVVMHRG